MTSTDQATKGPERPENEASGPGGLPFSVDEKGIADFLDKTVALVCSKMQKERINAYQVARESKLASDTLYRFLNGSSRRKTEQRSSLCFSGRVNFLSALKILLAVGLKVSFSDPGGETDGISIVLSKK